MRIGQTMLLAVAAALGGCSEPSAVYHTSEGDPVALFKSPDFSFRFGRSLVLVSADDAGAVPATGPKPASTTSALETPARNKTGAASADQGREDCPAWKFSRAVIDPLLAPKDGSWSNWESLPGWEPIDKENLLAFSYRIRLTPDTSVTIDEEAFRGMQGEGLPIFPVASCAALDLEIGTSKECVAPTIQSWRLKVAAVPSEFTPPNDKNVPSQMLAPVWRVHGEDNFFSVTKLNVSYVPDTLIVKQLGVKVDDKTNEIIQGVGGALVALAPLIVGGVREPFAVQRFSIKVADNRRLRSIPLPEEGKIDLPDTCTANVTETSTAGSGDVVGSLKTTIDQVKAIYSAWVDAKKKTASK